MKKIFYLLFSISFLFSCSKEGPGGKATIHGLVKHYGAPIPGADVYIKYGAKESPGTNITYYDASVAADANAYYEFVDLKKGDYYLFSVGFDSTYAQVVIGGVPVKIKSKTETVEADVPVTE